MLKPCQPPWFLSHKTPIHPSDSPIFPITSPFLMVQDEKKQVKTQFFWVNYIKIHMFLRKIMKRKHFFQATSTFFHVKPSFFHIKPYFPYKTTICPYKTTIFPCETTGFPSRCVSAPHLTGHCPGSGTAAAPAARRPRGRRQRRWCLGRYLGGVILGWIMINHILSI